MRKTTVKNAPNHYLLECDGSRKLFTRLAHAECAADKYIETHGQDYCFVRLDRVDITIDGRIECTGDFDVLSHPIKKYHALNNA